MKIYLLIAASFAALAFSAFGASPKNAEQLYKAATNEFDSNKVKSSLALYLKADSAYRAEGKAKTPEYAQLLHDTGRAFLSAEKLAEGRDYTLKAMDLRRQLFGKASPQYTLSLNNYALSFLTGGDPATALKHQLEVIQLCKQENPSDPNEGMFLINLGRYYLATGDKVNAAKNFEEALPKVEKFGSYYEYALSQLGDIYLELEDNANINRVLGLMEEFNAHKLKEDCNDPDCHLERAEYYRVKGDIPHAKDEFMAVLAMPLSESQKAKAYENYAQFLTGQNDWQQGADYYVMAANAVKKEKESETEKFALLLSQAGLSYFVAKDFDKSIEIHREVISLVDKNGYSEKIKSLSLEGLGDAYRGKKDLVNAIASYKRWMEFLEKNGHSGGADYARALELLGEAEQANEDYDVSIAHYEKAMELYGKLGKFEDQERTSARRDNCRYLAKKDTGDSQGNSGAKQQKEEKMRGIIRSSLDMLEQTDSYLDKLSLAQVYATISGAYNVLGEYDKSIEYYSKYIPAIRVALAEDFLLKNPKERELTWRQELSNIQEMDALMTKLPADNFDLYAKLSSLIYEGQLLSKGLLLSSNIEFDKVISKNGSKEMKSQYDAIKANLAEINKMKQGHKPIEEIQKLVRTTEAMQLALARESAKYGIYTDFLNISAQDVLNALKDDEAAIEFVTLDTEGLPMGDLIAAVLISKEFPNGITIPIGYVGQLQTLSEDKEKFKKDEYCAQIWNSIVQCIPNKKRIYFAPDGILNNIGIEYLTLAGKPMSEYLDLCRVSSTREIVRNHPAPQMKYVALFGDIDYADYGAKASKKKKYAKRSAADGINFERLEESGREVSEIQSILKKSKNVPHVFLYTGNKASKAEFLSQKDVPVNVLHISTHGKYFDDNQSSETDAMNRSLLAFAGTNLYNDLLLNEGIVTATEISEMTLPDCELAVLSACESGIGKLGSDGVFGLQRGFKNAGVKSLLVSLKEVFDEPTADMMISFYRNLFDGSGNNKREALRKAQSEIRAKYPDDDTWASFILIDSFN